MLPPVPDIDFLPAGYRQKRVRRRAGRWRGLVAVGFLALIGVGLLGNRVHHAQLTAEHDQLSPQAQAVRAADTQLAALRERAATLSAQADLMARLQLRAATTSLLAAVTAPLPADFALTNLRISEEPPKLTTPATLPATTPTGPPEQRDLEQLGVLGAERTALHLEGEAPDPGAIDGYLARLEADGLFDEVRLLATERRDRNDLEMWVFEVQLIVRSPQRLAAAKLAFSAPGTADAAASTAGVTQ